MEHYEDEIMKDLRDRQAALLEMYGGIEGLHRHMDEELPLLIKQGCKVVSAEEVAARNDRQRQAEAAAL